MTFLTIPSHAHSHSHTATAAHSSSGGGSGTGVVPSYISPQADDEVGDMAMMALKRESKSLELHGVSSSGLTPDLIGPCSSGESFSFGSSGGEWNDGSWVTSLLSSHISNRYRDSILKPLNSRTIMPVPLRIGEVSQEKELQGVVMELERVFRVLPEKMKRAEGTVGGPGGGGGGGDKGKQKGGRGFGKGNKASQRMPQQVQQQQQEAKVKGKVPQNKGKSKGRPQGKGKSAAGKRR
jgi:hypothetical protein